MKIFATGILMTAIAMFLATATGAIAKGERIECETWKKESSEIQGYWVTDWQVKQCRSYGIEL